MPTIATQTDFEVLNMSSMTAVKRNKMSNLANKDKRAWLRANFGKDWWKENKKERIDAWKLHLFYTRCKKENEGNDKVITKNSKYNCVTISPK
jgi:hypothetical protein